jgi:hypothetical protein
MNQWVWWILAGIAWLLIAPPIIYSFIPDDDEEGFIRTLFVIFPPMGLIVIFVFGMSYFINTWGRYASSIFKGGR